MSIHFYTNPMSRGQIVRWMLEEVGERPPGRPGGRFFVSLVRRASRMRGVLNDHQYP